MKVLETKNLKKQFKMGKDNIVKALNGIDLTVEKGEMVAIIGPSGSGKSTLMHILGCLDTADEGEVWINNEKVSALKNKELVRIRSQEIGFVFQAFNLITTLTALENVSLSAEYAGKSRKEASKMAQEMLKKVNLNDRMNHHPKELSGGQIQRVAIARALINNPSFILADEPTGNLDTASSESIMKTLRDVNKQENTTIVLVTHNEELAKMCDRIIKIKDGKVVK